MRHQEEREYLPQSRNADRPRTAPMSAQAVDRMLDLLISDDEYRALFQRDPRTALAQVGHELAANESCTFGITLASKQTIFTARAEIRGMLMQGLAQNTPMLDSGLSARCRLR